jgi:hypothetical protein
MTVPVEESNPHAFGRSILSRIWPVMEANRHARHLDVWADRLDRFPVPLAGIELLSKHLKNYWNF